MAFFSEPLLISSFAAGVLMFFAPCTLPIVPGFLAYLSGTNEAALLDRAPRALKNHLVLNALMFCLGFSAVFVLLGVIAGLFGHALGAVRPFLTIAAGAAITLFGIGLLVSYSFKAFTRLRLPLPRFVILRSLRGSLVFGALFALGFSPCIGPVLASVLLLASTKGSVLYGSVLLFVFSVGFSIPFLVTALAYGTVTHLIHVHERATRLLYCAAGAVLVLIGIPLLLAPFGIGLPFSLLGFPPFAFLAQFY